MKKILSLFFILIVYSISYAQIQHDCELWATVGIKKNLKKHFSWDASYQIRADHDMQAFKSSYISSGITYDLNKYVAFDLSYRYATSYIRDLHRFSGSLILTYKYKKIEFSLRNMYQNEREYFHTRYEVGHTPQNFLRERLQITYAIKKPLKIEISAEPFLLLSNRGISLNRVRCIASINYKFFKYHSINLGYLSQPNFPFTKLTQAITVEYTYTIPDWKKLKKFFKPKSKK
ncbi:MAG: DUF2490 domain-containing protein [Bacteroidota bacterium]